MGWISNLLSFYRKKAPAPVDAIPPGKGRFLGELTVPFAISFSVESPPAGGGVMLWGYSDIWTGGKGGSGFEFTLSPSRLKIIGIRGNAQEQRFSLPWWGATYSANLTVRQDRMEFHFLTADNPIGVRMQVLDAMPASIFMGIGWPPHPLTGFKGASFKNIIVNRL